jgi:hypothetical protein
MVPVPTHRKPTSRLNAGRIRQPPKLTSRPIIWHAENSGLRTRNVFYPPTYADRIVSENIPAMSALPPNVTPL